MALPLVLVNWVINNSVLAAQPSSHVLRRRALAEIPQIEAVRSTHARRIAVVPLMAREPVGVEGLNALVQKNPRVRAT